MPPIYIVLFDGTDAVAETGTNISKIKEMFKSVPSGNMKYIAGTNTRSASKITNRIQRLWSTELHRDVSEAIAWLDGKDPGDLYVFGYSRGAIAARYFAQCITNKNFTAQYNIDPPSTIWPVEFLGLMDPVYGPFNFLAKAPDYESNAVHNTRVKSYVEVNALNEHRFIMRLRSGKKNYIRWIKNKATNENKSLKTWSKTSSDITATSYYKDRENMGAINKENPLEDTGRYFEFLNGGHADVGGQNSCEVVAARALLTVLLTALEKNENLRKSVDTYQLDDLIHFADAAGEPTLNKSVSRFGKTCRVLGGLGIEYSRRHSFRRHRY